MTKRILYKSPLAVLFLLAGLVFQVQVTYACGLQDAAPAAACCCGADMAGGCDGAGGRSDCCAAGLTPAAAADEEATAGPALPSPTLAFKLPPPAAEAAPLPKAGPEKETASRQHRAAGRANRVGIFI